ncbi:MAG: hypothetical protein JWM95_2169, partial [Gemmatimonadetes bacterium]|nr:hypothetical protein [Gemmatimonadota bacterium]
MAVPPGRRIEEPGDATHYLGVVGRHGGTRGWQRERLAVRVRCDDDQTGGGEGVHSNAHGAFRAVTTYGHVGRQKGY